MDKIKGGRKTWENCNKKNEGKFLKIVSYWVKNLIYKDVGEGVEKGKGVRKLKGRKESKKGKKNK